MKKAIYSFIAITCLVLLTFTYAEAGWRPGGKTKSGEKGVKDSKVSEAIASFKENDPGIQTFFDAAHGYAIFPSVGKGGIGIGGAHGKGEVYEQGKRVGKTKLTQLTIGFQLGGQKYSEIIFFKNKQAIEDFKSGNYELGAQASAVAITAGASATAAYDNGVAIFTIIKGGLMYEATVGGQKFSYKPVK